MKRFVNITRNILSVVGLIWILFIIIHINTYDIRLGYEDSDITLNVKKYWGLKQERYFVEFNEQDDEWKYWTDSGKKHKWARINKNSTQFPLPEKAGIYDFLLTPERENRDFSDL